MCGIIAYIGKKKAVPVLAAGIRDMEYRGYDSCGLAVNNGKKIYVRKALGAYDELKSRIDPGIAGHCGIGHNRWATHGKPSRINAHPHSDCGGDIWVVHNGIIENYKELKDYLIDHGHKFRSETDTEVLPHLLEHYCRNSKSDLWSGLEKALTAIKGAYGLVIMHRKYPDRLWLARMASPMVLGVGTDEMLAASDIKPISRYTDQVVYLEDGDLAEIKSNSYRLRRNGSYCRVGHELIPRISKKISRKNFPHIMIKEIMEQPAAVSDSLRGRVILDKGKVKLGGLEAVSEKLGRIDRLLIVACGTAYYAGLTGKYWLEKYGHISVEVEIASELRYRSRKWSDNEALLAISQSGETADTLEAVKKAKQAGVLTLGLVNVVNSSIARETDAGVYNHIGPEEAVASTKAFCSQLVILMLMSVFLGRQRKMQKATAQELLNSLLSLPADIRTVLKKKDQIKELASKYRHCRSFIFLGRSHCFPIALEGALKLEEVANVFAKGHAGGEIKHGPLAMVDDGQLCIYLCPVDPVYDKNISNIQEIAARGGQIIAISDSLCSNLRKISTMVIDIPSQAVLSPILAVVPLQLFAYYMGVIKGKNVDKPRNLAKSVTVE